MFKIDEDDYYLVSFVDECGSIYYYSDCPTVITTDPESATRVPQGKTDFASGEIQKHYGYREIRLLPLSKG